MYGMGTYGSLPVAGLVEHSRRVETPWYIGGPGFFVDDLILGQRIDKKTDGSNLEIYRIEGYVDRIDAEDIAHIKVTKGAEYLRKFPIDIEVVRVGNRTNAARRGSIYLTSDDTNAPFIDIIDNVASFDSTRTDGLTNLKTIKVRLGKLDGITSSAFGALTGYGIYTQRGFFEGSILASLGGTNTVGITAEGSGEAAIRFFAGQTYANRTTAPSRISQGGEAWFTNVHITGGDVAGLILTELDNIPLIDALTITNNSPIAGSVAWSAFKIRYQDTTYSIVSGNTANKYIWWVKPATTLSTGASPPVIANDTFIIAINQSGTAFRSLFQNVIYADYISAGAVTADKISVGDLSAINVNAGSLTAGTLTGLLIRTSSGNARIELTSGNDIKIYGQVTSPTPTSYLIWQVNAPTAANSTSPFNVIIDGDKGGALAHIMTFRAENTAGADVELELDGVNNRINVTKQVNSSVATGTAPFAITSTTAVANLNADLLDGSHASAFAPVGTNVTSVTLQRDPTGTATMTFTNGSLTAYSQT